MSHKRGTVNPENGSKWWLFILNQRLDHFKSSIFSGNGNETNKRMVGSGSITVFTFTAIIPAGCTKKKTSLPTGGLKEQQPREPSAFLVQKFVIFP